MIDARSWPQTGQPHWLELGFRLRAGRSARHTTCHAEDYFSSCFPGMMRLSGDVSTRRYSTSSALIILPAHRARFLGRAQSATPAATTPSRHVTTSPAWSTSAVVAGSTWSARGRAAPRSSLEAGYRSPATVWTDDLSSRTIPRTMVLPGVAAFTRVCAYERPGAAAVRRRVAAPEPQRPGAHATDRRVSRRRPARAARPRRLPGPYVLVGHSLGGLFVRLYAATYPDEVAGLVLVDAWSEELKELLTPEQWESYVRFNSVVPTEMANDASYETLDFAAASEAMATAAAAHPLPAIPLVVLAHGQPFGVPQKDSVTPPTCWRPPGIPPRSG